MGNFAVYGHIQLTKGIIHLALTQNFPKNKNFFPLMRTFTCAYQRINLRFFGKFCLLAKWMVSKGQIFIEVLSPI